MATDNIMVEKDRPNRPHEGKVFLAVQAHLDDIIHNCAGLCAKLIHEGYTGYFVRTSNDEKRGGQSTARNILSNEQEHLRMAQALGCKDVFDFYYQNHEMNGISSLDIRGRLVFLIRMLKADTVLTFNPWGHWEENPDHWVTARTVALRTWMARLHRIPPGRTDPEPDVARPPRVSGRTVGRRGGVDGGGGS